MDVVRAARPGGGRGRAVWEARSAARVDRLFIFSGSIRPRTLVLETRVLGLGNFVYTPHDRFLEVSRDNFRSTVVNHTKRRQNTPYNYILISWGRCELSRIVSRLFVTRRTTKGQSAVLKLGSERAFLRCHESTTQSRDNVRTSLTNYIHLPHTITP